MVCWCISVHLPLWTHSTADNPGNFYCERRTPRCPVLIHHASFVQFYFIMTTVVVLLIVVWAFNREAEGFTGCHDSVLLNYQRYWIGDTRKELTFSWAVLAWNVITFPSWNVICQKGASKDFAFYRKVCGGGRGGGYLGEYGVRGVREVGVSKVAKSFCNIA